MNFLVVQHAGRDTCKLWVERNPETKVTSDFETWAIQSGKQVLFVNQTLGRKLENLRVTGNYMQGKATYALEYHEMCAVIRQFMGPTDMERYQALVADAPRPSGFNKKWLYGTWIVVGVGLTTFAFVTFALKFLIAMILVPFAIMWFKRNDH